MSPQLARLGATLRSWGRHLSPRAVILNYHRICEVPADPWGMCVTPGNFAQQLAVLRRHAEVISLGALAAQHRSGRLPDRVAAITFDDGYADNYTHAVPLLERFDAPASVFIASGQIGSTEEFWWDDLERSLLGPTTLPELLSLQINGETKHWHLGAAAEYSAAMRRRDRGVRAWLAEPGSRLHFYYLIWDVLRRLPQAERRRQQRSIADWAQTDPRPRPTHRALDRDQLRALAASALIDIGAHTVTHLFLPNCPTSEQRAEINDGKQYLEELLDRPVTGFAYPHGEYSVPTRQLVAEAGFEYACALGETAVRKSSDMLLLPRCCVENCDAAAFESQLHAWFER